jgi:hypothetical protein
MLNMQFQMNEVYFLTSITVALIHVIVYFGYSYVYVCHCALKALLQG